MLATGATERECQEIYSIIFIIGKRKPGALFSLAIFLKSGLEISMLRNQDGGCLTTFLSRKENIFS